MLNGNIFYQSKIDGLEKVRWVENLRGTIIHFNPKINKYLVQTESLSCLVDPNNVTLLERVTVHDQQPFQSHPPGSRFASQKKYLKYKTKYTNLKNKLT